MKVLIISHYLNFNLNNKNKVNIFPRLLLNAIKNAGMTYEICTFTLQNVMNGIKNGCMFIFNFEEASTQNAIKFMGDTKPDAINRMFKCLYDIEKKVPIYPPIHMLQLIKSKTYLELIPNKSKLFMPYTKTFMFYKTTISKKLSEVCHYFTLKNIHYIVIKFGYIGDSEHVFKYAIDSLESPLVKSKLLDEMTEYRVKCGIPFLVIVQPFNPIISNRLNEYRCLFVGGQLSPIAAFGFSKDPIQNTRIHIPSNELNPEENIDHAYVVTLAKYGYDMMSRYVGLLPPVLRIDVSWVLENNVKRFYINEYEGLSGTYYFNLPYIPKRFGAFLVTDKFQCTPKICKDYPEKPQLLLANSLVQYIKDHSDYVK